MFKKGLVTLVCLTVLSAVWAFATTQYSVSTKINSLGTYNAGTALAPNYQPIEGGTIKTRVVGAPVTDPDKALHSLGTMYTNVLHTEAVEATVTPKAGYKITAVTKAKYTMVNGLPVLGAYESQTIANDQSFTTTFSDPDPVAFPRLAGKTQFLVATFAPIGGGSALNWQLQVQNNNLGGTVTVNRGTAGQLTYLNKVVDLVGKPWIKNFIEAGATTLTVTAAPGYKIDYIVQNGVKTFYGLDSKVITFTPSATARIRTFNVGYKKSQIRVTTSNISIEEPNNPSNDGGIAPIDPVADPYGNVRLIVTPPNTLNTVTGVTAVYTDAAVQGATPFSTAKVKFFDRFNTPLPSLAGHIGPVKVTISGIDKPITVTATYGTNYAATASVQNCTNTCHIDPTLVADKPQVAAVNDLWAASKHSTTTYARVDCVACHYDAASKSAMPGLALTAANNCETCHTGRHAQVLSAGHAADPNSCFNCHNPHSTVASPANCGSCHATATAEWTASAHGTASGHTTGTCQRCHATEGSVVGATYGWTGSYATLTANEAAVWTPNAGTSTGGIKCAACHDAHSGELRQINTYVSGAVAAWDPNGNAAIDQYDVCTSCHTLTDNSGAVVGNYHDGGSVNVTRTITDSHFDLASTGTTAAGTTVEGYVIRTASANPCADCHNLHTADLTVQEEWAKSGHAGGIAAAKDAAACTRSVTWFNATYPTNTAATACTDSRTVGSSTRTVLSFFQRSTDGVAFYKAQGATDTTGVAWTHYNWDKTSDTTPGDRTGRGDCQRCHTATGVANFLANPATYSPANNDFSHLAGWTTTSGSAQQELLYCWGCHSDSQTGTLRNPGALTFDYSGSNPAEGDTVVYADVNKSNVCVACHSGNGGSGDTIANQPQTVDFGNLAAIQPHYLAAAGTLMTQSTNGGIGYEFAGVTYTKNGIHQKIGTADFYNTGTDGPCVSCHMSGAEKHTFEVSAASAVCANCHAGLTDALIEEAKTAYHNSLEELNTALKAKGIFFIPSYPYFVYDNGFGTGSIANNGIIETGEKDRNNGIKNWTTQVAGGNAKDTMGAAFNYNLLVHEPGAFAHNKAYAYELIQSSIDYLADGKVDGIGVNAIVAAAAASKEFAEATSHTDAIVATATPATTCDDCHTPAPHFGGNAFLKAQYVSTASQPVSCANCHGTPADAAAYKAIVGQYADSAHAAEDAEAWIHYDWRTANRSACARCHNGTAFVAKLGAENDITNVFVDTDVLKPGETLACSACHTDAAAGELRTPSSLFTINMKNGASAEYTVAGASALCARCHSGRETGASIKADLAADGARAFIDSHYQPVTGILYSKGGYGYSSQTYDTLGSHKTLGASGNGPCVTCHMAGGNHSFAAAACNTCHDGAPGKTVIGTQKATYDAALNNLKLALEAKGIYYGPTHPFFFTTAYVPRGDNIPVTNWAIGGANWKDVMGAAFNYNMLMSDKGAYAHNYAYAMKLIEDSTAFMGTVVLP